MHSAHAGLHLCIVGIMGDQQQWQDCRATAFGNKTVKSAIHANMGNGSSNSGKMPSH